jgi:cytochrome c-type biogenesis protein CcmH/NrfG
VGRWWKSFSNSCKYLGASLAIVLVKRKLGRRPHDWTLWLTLGRLYEVGYQWPQAIDALKNARKLDPDNEIIARQLSQTKKAAKQDLATKP